MVTTVFGSELKWAPATLGGCGGSGLEATSTVVAVPATYNPEGGSVNLFVKRYMPRGQSKTRIIIFMLPGGPGQSETILESHIPHLNNYLGNDVAYYLFDMRGVGQSDSFVRPNTYDWEGAKSQAKMPLNSINLTTAAMDVLQVAKMVSVSQPGVQLVLFGVSFGANWAHRVSQLDQESLFSRFIMDSILGYDGYLSAQNDHPLIDNCLAHPYCREQFKGLDRAGIKGLLKDILTPTTNKCAEDLVSALNHPNFDQNYTLLDRLHFIFQPLLEGKEKLEPTDRYQASMLTLAFLRGTHLCLDHGSYKGILNGLLKRRNLARSSAANGDEMNMVVNHLIFSGEAFDFPSGSQRAQAESQCEKPRLIHQCLLYKIYNSAYPNYQSAVCPRDPVYSRPPTNRKASYYFIQGKLDMMTPWEAAQKVINSVPGARTMSYNNLGHALISNGPCARFIYREAVLGDSKSKTDDCLNQINSVPLDWTFKRHSHYVNWWDTRIDASKFYLPDPVLGGSSSKSPFKLIIIICSAVGALILSAVVAYLVKRFYWDRRKRQPSQKVNNDVKPSKSSIPPPPTVKANATEEGPHLTSAGSDTKSSTDG